MGGSTVGVGGLEITSNKSTSVAAMGDMILGLLADGALVNWGLPIKIFAISVLSIPRAWVMLLTMLFVFQREQ